MKNKGITLISLVVTVIVLIILAGISISMLNGDNGLLKRAGQARDDTVVGQEKESVELAYISAAVKKLGADVDEEALRIELNNSVGTGKTSVSTNDDSTLNVYFTDTEHNYTVDNGNVSVAIEYPLASEVLKINTSAITDAEKSPYVNYPSAKGTIKCRVLYNDITYGLQIISVNPVTNLTLSGKNLYNTVITTLNEETEKYKETADGIILATDARCVGSDPTNKNYPDNASEEERTAEMLTITEDFMASYSGKYFKSDTHYETDKSILDKIGITKITDDMAITNQYWLASRITSTSSNTGSFSVRVVKSDGSVGAGNMWYLTKYSGSSNKTVAEFTNSPERGLRPIFILASDVKIIGGDGTEESPYILGK